MFLNKNKICRKCSNEGIITIKKDSIYCEACYLICINHKFRSCIGKSKIISPNEKVLVGLSGGVGSVALLSMIHNGITLKTHKKLRIEPIFVHLTEANNISKNDIVNALVEQCKAYNFEMNFRSISTYTSGVDIGFSSTTQIDFQKRLIQNALVCVARELKCKMIFTGESATNLAAKLLTDLVIGRGSQVENDVAFADNRHDNIAILRPLRDITKEELQHYTKIKRLAYKSNKNTLNSLQCIINKFVSTLETETPSTISTICKTADKIGSDSCCENEKSCVFCKGNLVREINQLTAIQATNLSRNVSQTTKRNKAQMDSPFESIEKIYGEEIIEKSMFPFIHDHLCYCCSRSYAEMNDSKIQLYIQGLIKN